MIKFWRNLLIPSMAAFLANCTLFDDADAYAQIANNTGEKVEITYIAKGPFDYGTSKQLSLAAGESITVNLFSEFGPDPRDPFPSDIILVAGTQHREIKRVAGQWGPMTENPFLSYAYGRGYRYQIEPDLKIYMIPPDCETPCKRLSPQPPYYPL